MFKTINKYSKLAIIFTGLYVSLGVFLMSNSSVTGNPMDWLPNFAYKNQTLLHTFLSIPDYLFWAIYTLLFLLILLAIVFGVLGLVRADKTQEKSKWVITILTLLNLSILIGSVLV